MSFLKKSTEKPAFFQTMVKHISFGVLALGALLMPLFYLGSTQDALNLPKSYLLYTLVLLGLLFWLLRVTVTKQLTLRRSVLDYPVLVFLVSTVIAAFASLSASVSFLGKTADFVLHAAFLAACACWLWMLIQHVRDSMQWRNLINVILASSTIAGGLFLLRTLPLFNDISRTVGFNTISHANSTFGMYMAAIAIVALGLLMVKRRSMKTQLLPLIAAVVSMLVIANIGFAVSWAIFAVGAGLLLVLGTTMLAETHVAALSTTFFLFLLSILFIFFSTPNFLKSSLPVEVGLGYNPSFAITTDAVLSGAKSFLIGSGPGTFVQNFSRYRPEQFNLNQLWSVRFQQPYNVPLAFFAEFGVLGALSFLFVVLLALGSVFSAWLKTRPSVWKPKSSEKDHDDPIRLEVFVLASSWASLTVAMFFSFFDVAIWWLWWTLLGLTLVGMSALVPTLIREKRVQLEVSPQYALAMSFGMVLMCTAIVVFGAFGVRLVQAEIAYTKAVNATSIEQISSHVSRAVELRSNYTPYRVANARIALQVARLESQKNNPQPQQLAGHIATAVNEAKVATDILPRDVETWETLGMMYVNARSFAPDANKWARDAFTRAVELEPTNPLLHVNLANTHAYDGSYEQAEEALITAIELKPDLVSAYIQLSQVYELQGDYDRAIGVYQPILGAIQNNAERLFNLGRLFYNRNETIEGLSDNERAEQVWLAAITLEPNYSNALYSLGLVYERMGDNESAVSYFERVQELNPNNPDIGDKIESLLAPTIAPAPPAPAPSESEVDDSTTTDE